MKTASTALQNFLLAVPSPNDHFFKADLFTFTLLDGSVLRLTDFGVDLLVASNTFLGTGVQIKRSKITEKIGIEVSSMTLDLIADPSNQFQGKPILSQMRNGAFDGATVKVERLIMPTLGDMTLGTVVRFVGTISTMTEIGRTHAQIEVKSLLELLNVQLPRNLFSPGCRHTLFDLGCALTEATFAFTGTAAAGATVINIPTNLTKPGPLAAPTAAPTLSVTTATSGVNLGIRTYYVVATYTGTAGESTYSPESFIALASNQTLNVASPVTAAGVTGWNVYVALAPGDEQRQNGTILAIGTAYHEIATGVVQGVPPPVIVTGGYFAQGKVKFTSGANIGLIRTVKQYFANGTLVVQPGFPFAPASGDTLLATAGCDKQMATCLNKFNNLIHFGGEPYVPTPEQAV